MRAKSAQIDPRPRSAATASASIVALVAIAVTVCVAQGANAAGLAEAVPSVSGVREASGARAVAAAVTAAVRDMVGHDRFDNAPHIECSATLIAPATQPVLASAANHDSERSHAPPIAPTLLNIPPPTN